MQSSKKVLEMLGVITFETHYTDIDVLNRAQRPCHHNDFLLLRHHVMLLSRSLSKLDIHFLLLRNHVMLLSRSLSKLEIQTKITGAQIQTHYQILELEARKLIETISEP